MAIRAALLDMDGTIFDSRIDWLGLREKLAIPYDGRPILAQLRDAPAELRARGLSLLHEAEERGAETGELLPGTEELLSMLQRQGVRCALVTNNSRRSVETVLRRFSLGFDLILTREDGAPKPEPDTFLLALDRLGVAASEAVAIGDAHFDLLAARRAEIREIVLVGTPDWMKVHIPGDAPYRFATDLDEARVILEALLSV